MKKITLIITSLSALFFACQKKEQITPSNHSPNPIIIPSTPKDTIKVIKDTTKPTKDTVIIKPVVKLKYASFLGIWDVPQQTLIRYNKQGSPTTHTINPTDRIYQVKKDSIIVAPNLPFNIALDSLSWKLTKISPDTVFTIQAINFQYKDLYGMTITIPSQQITITKYKNPIALHLEIFIQGQYILRTNLFLPK